MSINTLCDFFGGYQILTVLIDSAPKYHDFSFDLLFTLSLRVMNRLRAPYGGRACAGHKFSGNFGTGAAAAICGNAGKRGLVGTNNVKTRWRD